MKKIKLDYLPSLYKEVAKNNDLYLPIEKRGQVDFAKWTQDSKVDLIKLKQKTLQICLNNSDLHTKYLIQNTSQFLIIYNPPKRHDIQITINKYTLKSLLNTAYFIEKN